MITIIVFSFSDPLLNKDLITAADGIEHINICISNGTKDWMECNSGRYGASDFVNNKMQRTQQWKI